MERRDWAGWIGCHEVKSQRVNYKEYSASVRRGDIAVLSGAIRSVR